MLLLFLLPGGEGQDEGELKHQLPRFIPIPWFPDIADIKNVC